MDDEKDTEKPEAVQYSIFQDLRIVNISGHLGWRPPEQNKPRLSCSLFDVLEMLNHIAVDTIPR